MTTGPDAARESAGAAAALARNDRYLLEFVEALRLCPFARRCRETGKLHRRVVAGEPTPQQLAEAVAEIERAPAGSIEVALLLCPDSRLAARPFEELCAALREELAARRLEAFYCVAFHPELPEDLADENRAVAFIRRSPDPTLQLVRKSVLREVREGHPDGSRFLDASKLTVSELLAVRAAPGVSEQIARDNHAALRARGPGRLRALLASMRAPK